MSSKRGVKRHSQELKPDENIEVQHVKSKKKRIDNEHGTSFGHEKHTKAHVKKSLPLNEGAPDENKEVRRVKSKKKRSDNESEINISHDKYTKAHVTKSLPLNESSKRKVKLLAELGDINETLAKTLVNYFENESTIPFMARYRKNEIQNKTPEELRVLKDLYDNICLLMSKSKMIIRALTKANKLTVQVQEAVNAARSMEELEFIYEPYKDKKGNKLEKAKALGLQPLANSLLYGNERVCVDSVLRDKMEETDKSKETIEGSLHIILEHMISTNADVLVELRLLKANERIFLSCTKLSKSRCKKEDELKYELYFKFSQLLSNIQPHQILAINRGVSKKVLSSEIVLPDTFMERLHVKARKIFLTQGHTYEDRIMIFDKAFQNAFRHKLAPMIRRTIRADLNRLAEKASLDVFANNLKCLLLSSPVRGVTVLAIDPGFHHGCKLAVVSPSGMPLYTGILHLTTSKNNLTLQDKLKHIILDNGVNVVAIGNGKGCRDVEEYISNIIEKGLIHPLDLSYTIVNEQGVSVYSCSKEAAEEFPNMNPNLISAISLGRRLLDPLSELVKVEPKHLGVGMYQHDVNKKKLDVTLCEVVSECVSSVGVDINTASKKLLRNVAGLNDKRVESIIFRRMNYGPFMNREELKSIKSIGPKTFQQCAGFIRIVPETVQKDNLSTVRNQLQPLDQTDIHPEFYDASYKLAEMCCVNTADIGSEKFIDKVKRWMLNKDLKSEAEKLGISSGNLEIVLASFTSRLGMDFRLQLNKPVFQKSIKTVENLKFGQMLNGYVTNVTHFGAFVDIGIGKNALIPKKFMHGRDLKLGNVVKVKVIGIDDLQKITLELVENI